MTNNLKFIICLIAIASSLNSIAQKKGAYLSTDDPLCETWKLLDNSDNVPVIAGFQQLFISLTSGSEQRSFMSPSILSQDVFECPTYFIVSRDEKYLYFEIVVPCSKNLTDDEKFIQVEYNLGNVKKVNSIEINGSKHEIVEMKSILTITIDGENYHYGISQP